MFPDGDRLAGGSAEDQVGRSILVKVADTNATTIIDIVKQDNLYRIIFRDGIGEINTSNRGKKRIS